MYKLAECKHEWEVYEWLYAKENLSNTFQHHSPAGKKVGKVFCKKCLEVKILPLE